jgi:hypothetical protein
MPQGHPARADLLETTANYTYTRGIGLESVYYGQPGSAYGGAGTTYRVAGNQREVLYLLPKLFLVYDRTRQLHSNAQAFSFTSFTDASGGNPIIVTFSGGHAFHSGAQVAITGCSNTPLNGTYIVTALDGKNISLNGATTPIGGSTCSGTATGNLWGHQVISWTTGAKPVEVTTAGQQSAGMRQFYVEAAPVNISAIANTTPVKVTTATPHLMNTGMSTVIASQSGGCAGLNGAWWVTVVDLYNFTLNGSTACGVVGAVGTSQKFNGAITTIKPATPPAVLQDTLLALGNTTAAGLVYHLEVHDPRNCTSNPSWCTPSSPATEDSQNWLTALDTSVSASDTATLTPLTATNADMVQVSATVVGGFQNAQVTGANCSSYTCTAPVPVLPIGYSYTQGIGNVTHYVAGMTPSTTYYVTAAAGSVSIAAIGSSGATTSTANGVLTFVSSGVPVPSISGLVPPSAVAGGAQFALTVNGANFDSSAVVAWNGTNLTTVYVNTGQVQAVVPALLIAVPGTASVTVTTTTGGTSAPATFSITIPHFSSALTGKAVLSGKGALY